MDSGNRVWTSCMGALYGIVVWTKCMDIWYGHVAWKLKTKAGGKLQFSSRLVNGHLLKIFFIEIVYGNRV